MRSQLASEEISRTIHRIPSMARTLSRRTGLAGLGYQSEATGASICSVAVRVSLRAICGSNVLNPTYPSGYVRARIVTHSVHGAFSSTKSRRGNRPQRSWSM
eukprot:scaffold52599_cov86-Attheya_sp.AAC.1